MKLNVLGRLSWRPRRFLAPSTFPNFEPATAPPGDSFAGARAKSKTGARTPPPSMQLPSAAAWPPIDLACPVALYAIYQAGLAIHCRAVTSACGTRLSRLWIVAACRAVSLQFLPRATLLKKYPVSSLYAKSGDRAIVLSHIIIDRTSYIVRQYYRRSKTAGPHGCRNTHAAPNHRKTLGGSING
jgi:hypothetical protein